MAFVKLFEPTKIGPMELRNRIVMLPMGTRFASEDGSVTERLMNYYAERAKGGVGFIIVGATRVDVRFLPQTRFLRADRNVFIAGLSELAEAVHAYGAKVAAQIHHMGRYAFIEAWEGKETVSASDVPHGEITPRPLTIEEIEYLVECFGEAAGRVKAAGFDAVELAGHHGYLLAQFVSPLTNKRTDKYGGSFERRIRFVREVIECVREKVGDDFPIGYKISGDELIEGGLTIEDTKVVAKKLEEFGINVLQVSAGLRESPDGRSRVQPMCVPRGCLVYLAEAIKKVVSIPIIAVGRINDPVLAEKILQEGKADLIGIGRALIADPELPKKAAEGRLDDIRPCIACMHCFESIDTGLNLPMKCAVNAAVGKEIEYRIRPADRSKKVLVVGGGPAGMEAARVAALRGHKVILGEKGNKLGGQLLLAAVPPYKEEIENLTRYLTNQVNTLGVKIELGKDVSPAVVEEIKPDVVIVATGSIPLIPKIPGIDRKNVVTAWDVLSGKVKAGDKNVVAGGGMVGCEVAEFLEEKGKKVTIVEMLDDIALDVPLRTRELLIARLAEHDIKILTNQKIEEITDRGVITIDNKWRKKIVESNAVVLALGSRSNKYLADALEGKVPELYKIGDCLKPRKILEAIQEGSFVAREI